MRPALESEHEHTFGEYFRDADGRNAALRTDHLLLSPALAPRVKVAGADRDVRGREKASDEAPAWVDLD